MDLDPPQAADQDFRGSRHLKEEPSGCLQAKVGRQNVGRIRQFCNRTSDRGSDYKMLYQRSSRQPQRLAVEVGAGFTGSSLR